MKHNISLLLFASATALAHKKAAQEAGGFSADLTHGVTSGANSKISYMIDTNVNKRQYERPKTSWLSDYLASFSRQEDTRTAFDRKFDAYVKKQAYAQRKNKSAKQLKQQESIDHDLVASSQMPMFTGEIRMGSEREILNVVYDTGSDWLVVPDASCSTCLGYKHDNTVSGTVVDEQESERLYGSAALVGTTWLDTVCLSANTGSCAENFEYFSFSAQTGLSPPIDGIMGMCQNKQMMLTQNEIVVGPLFHEALYDQFKITEPTFSFAMKGYSTDVSSTVDFGEPAPYRVKGFTIDETSSVTFGFNDDFFWSTSVQAMAFGDDSYKLDGAPYTIFDTGSSHLMVPPLLLQPILDAWVEASGGIANYVIQQGLVFVDCAQKAYMKPMKFMFSEYWVEIAVEDYIWDASGDGSVCMMLMAANSYDFFLLGQPIYQKYYTIHNTAQSTIKFAPLDLLNAKLPQPGTIPETSFVPSDPPTFAQTYGQMIFLLACSGFATFVYLPLLTRWFGEFSTRSYVFAYGLYITYCWALYTFILQVWFDLPALNYDSIAGLLSGTTTNQLMASMAVGGAALAAYKSGVFDSTTESKKEEEQGPLETQLKLVLDKKAALNNLYIANQMA